eukprot:CAMPEP_0171124628 /NCGR_PEP_ID=MMETSP0766_2-20121228/109537_1 /TAXON_ID=439317 /ORGANISM="Gambierdiscus australes, Strain CAWD 149" /LENGTH=39 /DNA_ID= /DNA_START= /DNA_END= /DNA_ORIENTATION=
MTQFTAGLAKSASLLCKPKSPVYALIMPMRASSWNKNFA